MPHEGVVFQTDPKQPDDVMHVPGVDFSERMTIGGEVLSSAEVTISERVSGQDKTAEMFVAGSLVVANNVVAFQVKAGEDKKDYLARIRGSTNQQRSERATVIIPVRSRPK
jgi:hypothetical protein